MKKLVGLLIITLLLGACAAPAEIPAETPEPAPPVTSEPSPETGGETGGGDVPAPTPTLTPTPTPEPEPAGRVVCKGFFMAGLPFTDDAQSMGQVARLQEAGANLVSIAPTVMIDPSGKVEYKRTYLNPTNEDFEARLQALVQRYHDAGIMVSLVVEVDYVSQLNQNMNEPGAIPASKAAQAGFLDQYNVMVVSLAQFAEDNGVEYLAPMNEPDRKLGAAAASVWGQQILPLVKSVYDGKVVFKGDFETACGAGMDFTGYDVLGFSSSPQVPDPEVYRGQVKARIDNALAWAGRDGVPDIMATEFGVWVFQGGFSEQDIASAHEIVFAEGDGRIQGFIVLDPMQGRSGGERALYGSGTFETVKNWFGKLK